MARPKVESENGGGKETKPKDPSKRERFAQVCGILAGLDIRAAKAKDEATDAKLRIKEMLTNYADFIDRGDVDKLTQFHDSLERVLVMLSSLRENITPMKRNIDKHQPK